MTIKQTHSKRIFKSGLAMLLVGSVLGITGYVSSPASAAGNDHQITICHATESGSNPYTTPNPNKWQITAPTGHGTLHADDIIPPFAAGSKGSHTWAAYPGLNWDAEGQEIFALGCNVAPPPGDNETGSVTLDKVTAGDGQPAGTTAFTFSVSCESGTASAAPTITPESPATVVATGVEVGDSCTIAETGAAGAASTTFSVDGGSEASGPVQVTVESADQLISVLVTNTYECPTGQTPDDEGGCTTTTDACPNVTGDQADTTECPTIVVTDACPALAGTQASVSECPTSVIGDVVSQSTDPVLLQGVQLAAAPAAPELPRTGRGTLPLAEFGLGLILMGAGALLFGREQTATV